LEKILFVCTGNTCRSSMAESIFNDLTKNDESIKAKAESAGTEAFDGMPANDKAIETLKTRGIDMNAHKSRRINAKIVDENDLILTMTRLHKLQIQTLYPQVKGKVFTLKEYAGDEETPDIADPFGHTPSVYIRCADELEVAIRAVLERLRSGAGG